VRFSMLPNTNLTNGSVIENIAHIVFDFNAPIITPPAVFTVDLLAGVEEELRPSFSVIPNPVKDQLRVMMRDGQLGSFSYRIHDLLGQQVSAGRSLGNGTIAVQELIPGMYTLLINTPDARGGLRFVKE